jgi:hemerythrin superfamily protein
MKILIFIVSVLGAIWLFSSMVDSRVQTAYRKGYTDGSTALAIDSQCVSWLMESNLKEAKKRICK